MSSAAKITNVRRLKRRDQEGTGWTESETWRVGFEGSSLPSHVYIYDMRVIVEPYVFPVTQCSKCWRYGHPFKMCPSKWTICPKCGGKHENCEVTSFKCINCSKNHMALDKTCPVYTKEKKLRDIMSEFNVSYRKALDMYVPPPPPPPIHRDSAAHTPRPTTSAVTPISPILQSKTNNTLDTENSAPAHNTLNQTQNEMQEQSQKINDVNSKKKKKKKRQPKISSEFEEVSQECEMNFCEETCRPDSSDEEFNEEYRPSEEFSFKELKEKIKQIIFMKKDTIKKKIISIIQISIEWAIVWICNFIIPKDLSCFKQFFNNG